MRSRSRSSTPVPVSPLALGVGFIDSMTTGHLNIVTPAGFVEAQGRGARSSTFAFYAPACETCNPFRSCAQMHTMKPGAFRNAYVDR